MLSQRSRQDALMLQLPATSPVVHVCVGAEWHRFPGSFFLPGPTYRLQFIQSGFTGLLPRHFNASEVRTPGAACSASGNC
jgi:hypothetical protein